ncbi:hydroxymethylglutaryl-CoA lyase [Tsukamurella soli]|uniref:Hydroxymethylglutaryl-CoA lyase n=1 Tax=Tsukamurella soli TaxID=644556 RepID=A0ABP8JTN4_9ACTN
MNPIIITDVVLRDGLQDEQVIVPTTRKVTIARALVDAGVTQIEAGSFVSPSRVPQMADAEDLFGALPRVSRVEYSGLALNSRGVERAVRCDVDVIEVAVSASSAHSAANAGKSTEEALSDISQTVARYPDQRFIAAVSTAFVCPFAGVITATEVLQLCEKLHSAGFDHIALADTLGTAPTAHVLDTVELVQRELPDVVLGLHLHNAGGQAFDTVLSAATELGIVHFDAALGGYGGCPFAPGAHGNIATEDLVDRLHRHGMDTGIDPDRLATAVVELRSALADAPPLVATTEANGRPG